MTQILHFRGEAAQAALDDARQMLLEGREGEVFRGLLEYRDCLRDGRCTPPLERPQDLLETPEWNAFFGACVLDGLGEEATPPWVFTLALPRPVAMWTMWTQQEPKGWGTTLPAWKLMGVKVAAVEVTNL